MPTEYKRNGEKKRWVEKRDWLKRVIGSEMQCSTWNQVSLVSPLATDEIANSLWPRWLNFGCIGDRIYRHHTAQWCTNAIMLRMVQNKQNSFLKFFAVVPTSWTLAHSTFHKFELWPTSKRNDAMQCDAMRWDAIQTKISEIANWNRHDNTKIMEYEKRKKKALHWVWFKAHLSSSQIMSFCAHHELFHHWPTDRPIVIWFMVSQLYATLEN